MTSLKSVLAVEGLEGAGVGWLPLICSAKALALLKVILQSSQVYLLGGTAAKVLQPNSNKIGKVLICAFVEVEEDDEEEDEDEGEGSDESESDEEEDE